MAATALITLPSAARATYSSGQVSLANFSQLELDIDINVTALTGGTSPTVTFKVSRVEADGVLYSVWSPSAISAAGTFSQSIGPGLQTSVDLGNTFQVDMVTTGSPTSITFSLNVEARGV